MPVTTPVQLPNLDSTPDKKTVSDEAAKHCHYGDLGTLVIDHVEDTGGTYFMCTRGTNGNYYHLHRSHEEGLVFHAGDMLMFAADQAPTINHAAICTKHGGSNQDYTNLSNTYFRLCQHGGFVDESSVNKGTYLIIRTDNDVQLRTCKGVTVVKVKIK